MILSHTINKLKFSNFIKFNIILYEQVLILKYQNILLAFYRKNKHKNFMFFLYILCSIFFFCVYNSMIYLNHNRTNNFLKKKNIVSYVINIRFKGTNILVSSSTIKGIPKMATSAGLIGFRGKQRKNKIPVLLLMLKKAFDKAEYLEKTPVTIHFKNINSKSVIRLVIYDLKETTFLNVIKNYDLKPHNGCRGKKIKNMKRRK